jgi:hypothetical protein
MRSLGWKEGSEIPGKELARKAYLVVRDSIDDAIDKAAPKLSDPKLAASFKEAKQAYGAARAAEKSLEDSIQRATGNRIVSLTDIIFATGQMAAGKPALGAASVVGKKLLESGGARSLGARTLSRTGGLASKVVPPPQFAVPAAAVISGAPQRKGN